jgi:phospholipid/cholesterol/gamma-HCH transport system ATP-binding protein
MQRKKTSEPFSVVVFNLLDVDCIMANLGPDVVHEAIRRMCMYIDKHFGIIGGFSTRFNTSEIVTVLPHSSLEEALSVLDDFTSDFRGQGIKDVWNWAGVRRLVAISGPITFTIVAGVAEGRPINKIETIINAARGDQREIWSATMNRQGE